MLRDPKILRTLLREKVLAGFDPSWNDCESWEDHWACWGVLSEREFDSIKEAARQERAHREVTSARA